MREFDFKQKWADSQMANWQSRSSEVVDLFSRFGVDVAETYRVLLQMDYEKVQPAAYLMGKIRKMVAVCDFLDSLTATGQDVEKIKIFHLISHAEITMRTFVEVDGFQKAHLVKTFFEPSEDLLKYSLKLSVDDAYSFSKSGQDTSPSNILYKLRNEYAHRGNFTGKIFADPGDDRVSNMFTFEWDIPGKQPVLVCADTTLSYDDFMELYFSAIKSHLEKYVKN